MLYSVPISWDRDNRVDFTAPLSKSISNDLNKVVIENSQPSWCTPSGVGLENTPGADETLANQDWKSIHIWSPCDNAKMDRCSYYHRHPAKVENPLLWHAIYFSGFPSIVHLYKF